VYKIKRFYGTKKALKDIFTRTVGGKYFRAVYIIQPTGIKEVHYRRLKKNSDHELL